jgi:hypothetical protein
MSSKEGEISLASNPDVFAETGDSIIALLKPFWATYHLLEVVVIAQVGRQATTLKYLLNSSSDLQPGGVAESLERMAAGYRAAVMRIAGYFRYHAYEQGESRAGIANH